MKLRNVYDANLRARFETGPNTIRGALNLSHQARYLLDYGCWPDLETGGRAAIEASDARREQLVETYRDTVRGAFTEVVDALDAPSAAAEIHGARTAQSAALQTALRLAQRRYDEGYADYLGVLDARRSLLQSRLAVAEARRSGGAAYVDLVLAVGGGWGPGPQLERLERNL